MLIEQQLLLLVLVNTIFIPILIYLIILGHDKCLEILLRCGMNPNIADRTNTTPLHVAYVKYKVY